jgi:ArsR family transcriptional regulator
MASAIIADRERDNTSPKVEGSPPPETCSNLVIHEKEVALARQAILDSRLLDKSAELFRIFGDPTRTRILSALTAAELCVCDLMAVLGMGQSAISHQLAILRSARLVKNRREGKTVYYSLDDEHVRHLLILGAEHVSEEGF